ncbi:MAG TPA: farnesyl diphosphate synthase [Candidatus Obscuribacterales bacterium]
MVVGASVEFKQYLTSRRQLVEDRLAEYLAGGEPAVLWESMRYSVLGGGKRLRPILCLAAAESVSADAAELALPCACSVEMIHAMSLIHDDLPALDNDDLRRGRPTNHKVFGEAIALLAGDALLMLALEVLLDKTPARVDRAVVLDVALALSRATGAAGMVGGQVEDMRFTGLAARPDEPITEAMMESVHGRKTGALLRFSIWSGARLAGAKDHILAAFSRFGQVLGLAFQITDDLLDVTGDAKTLGKTPGKDEAADKATWVRLFGVDESRQKLAALESEGKALLRSTGLDTGALSTLESLLEYAIHRVS